MHVIGLHLFVRDFFPSVLTFLMNGEARKNVWNIISIFVDDFAVFEYLEHSFNFLLRNFVMNQCNDADFLKRLCAILELS